MKIFIIMVLFSASVCGADTVTTNINVDITTTNSFTTNIDGDITTTISELWATDGKPWNRTETVYRGKTKVLEILSSRDKQGKLAVFCRHYFVNGVPQMEENDFNRDGSFTISLLNTNHHDFEVFVRQPDGSVKPMPTKALDTLKKTIRDAD
jgi:hypothetical protein